MIKRTIDISEGPTFLSIELDQLVISREGKEIGRVPCEDIGLLLVDNHWTTYTHAVVTRLLHFGGVIVLCREDHLPAGMVLSFEPNSLLTERLRIQAGAKLPLRKRLWRQIVRHKIRGQVANMPHDDPASRIMLKLAERVRSGDPQNHEGQAAVLYWPAMFGPDFRRERDGLPPNNLLNYGYAVMRAAIARAICSAGLHPAFGLHHHNRSNPFCLADDLLEVFRPRVDAVVMRLVLADNLMLDRSAKTALLQILTDQITIAEQSGPLMVALHRMVSSLVRCYEGLQKHLDLPDMP